MPTLTFATRIAAAPSRVWDILFSRETYPRWTAAFMEGSTFEGSWEQGSRMRFHDGSGNGMVAEIAENRRPDFLSIKHLGTVNSGVEDTDSEEVRRWTPAFETYTLAESGGTTELTIHVDVPDEWRHLMEEAWPMALAAVKALSEARA